MTASSIICGRYHVRSYDLARPVLQFLRNNSNSECRWCKIAFAACSLQWTCSLTFYLRTNCCVESPRKTGRNRSVAVAYPWGKVGEISAALKQWVKLWLLFYRYNMTQSFTNRCTTVTREQFSHVGLTVIKVSQNCCCCRISPILPRNAYATHRPMHYALCVSCPSQAGIVSKRLNAASWSSKHRG